MEYVYWIVPQSWLCILCGNKYPFVDLGIVGWGRVWSSLYYVCSNQSDPPIFN